MRIKWLSWAMLAVAFLSGCSGEPTSPGSCICTDDFATVSFLVMDVSGAPQSGISASVELVRTGEILHVPQPTAAVGVVNVIDDSFLSILDQGPELLRVTGGKDSTTFTEDFEVEAPEPCRCHVTKVSGPDFVVLR